MDPITEFQILENASQKLVDDGKLSAQKRDTLINAYRNALATEWPFVKIFFWFYTLDTIINLIYLLNVVQYNYFFDSELEEVVYG